MLTMPPLLTAYAKWPGGPIIPCCEEIRIRRPRASPSGSCSTISPIAARAQRKTPRRLTAMIASQSSSVVSSSGFECAPAMPALRDDHVEAAVALDARRATRRSTSAARDDVGLDVAAALAEQLGRARAALARAPARGRRRRRALPRRRIAARSRGRFRSCAPVTTRSSRRQPHPRIPYAAAVRIAMIGAGWIAADHVGRIAPHRRRRARRGLRPRRGARRARSRASAPCTPTGASCSSASRPTRC